MSEHDKNVKNLTQEQIKVLITQLLSSDLKPAHGESHEEFTEKLKARALPIIKDLDGANLKEINPQSDLDISDHKLSEELKQRIDKEHGIAVRFSEDSAHYQQIKTALLEVLNDLGAEEISVN